LLFAFYLVCRTRCSLPLLQPLFLTYVTFAPRSRLHCVTVAGSCSTLLLHVTFTPYVLVTVPVLRCRFRFAFAHTFTHPVYLVPFSYCRAFGWFCVSRVTVSGSDYVLFTFRYVWWLVGTFRLVYVCVALRGAAFCVAHVYTAHVLQLRTRYTHGYHRLVYTFCTVALTFALRVAVIPTFRFPHVGFARATVRCFTRYRALRCFTRYYGWLRLLRTALCYVFPLPTVALVFAHVYVRLIWFGYGLHAPRILRTPPPRLISGRTRYVFPLRCARHVVGCTPGCAARVTTRLHYATVVPVVPLHTRLHTYTTHGWLTPICSCVRLRLYVRVWFDSVYVVGCVTLVYTAVVHVRWFTFTVRLFTLLPTLVTALRTVYVYHCRCHVAFAVTLLHFTPFPGCATPAYARLLLLRAL